MGRRAVVLTRARAGELNPRQRLPQPMYFLHFNEQHLFAGSVRLVRTEAIRTEELIVTRP
jgi:hypothetical protein